MKTWIALFLIAGISAPLVRADDSASHASVKISAPDQPIEVRIFVGNGSVKIIGKANSDTVDVDSNESADNKSETRSDGLRVLSSAESFTLSEKNNVVELSYGRGDSRGGDAGDFTVTVPQNALVEVGDGWNTDVTAENLKGDITIKTMSGAIHLNNVSGGAIIETMNGAISANFAGVPSGKPLSFTSMNGEIDLHLPADAKANVRFRTQNGSILTDFPEDVLKTKTVSMGNALNDHSATAKLAAEAARDAVRAAQQVAEEVQEAVYEATREAKENSSGDEPHPPHHLRVPHPSIPAIVGGKVVSGTLNGGGMDIQAATMNGDIVVRRNAAK